MLQLVKLEGAVVEMTGCDGVLSYLGCGYCTVFYVVSEDTSVLQAPGIELADCAVLIAIGLREDGYREVLGFHLGNKESYHN